LAKYLLILIILFSSCSVQRRCNRHINKLTKLGCLKADTITKYDTIIGFQIDTFVKFSDSSRIDTLFLEKNGLKSQTIIKWKTKEVFQNVFQKDTIIKTQSINKYLIKTEYKVPLIYKILLGAFSLLALFLYLFKK